MKLQTFSWFQSTCCTFQWMAFWLFERMILSIYKVLIRFEKWERTICDHSCPACFALYHDILPYSMHSCSRFERLKKGMRDWGCRLAKWTFSWTLVQLPGSQERSIWHHKMIFVKYFKFVFLQIMCIFTLFQC